LPNNVKEFFETGKTLTNSVSMQGGNAQSSYYLSYANVNGDGIMPTDVDSYKRNTISVRGSTALSNNITSSASLNYARTNSSFVPTGQGTTVYNNLLQTPRDIPIRELADINNPFNDLEGYYSEYTTNPYYALKKFGSKANIDRLYGNVELGYKANDWLSFTGRVGTDISTTQFENWSPKNKIVGPNSPTTNPGNYSFESDYSREFNSDLLMNINKNLSPALNLSGLVGWNVNQRQTTAQFSQINDLVIPDFYNLSNTANTPTSTLTRLKRRLTGVYSQANLTYKSFLYLSLSARNDWSSTLPSSNRSFFYPSVNLGLDITSALKMDSKTLSYAKIRGALSQVGKDAGPYSIKSVYIQSTHGDGFINLNAPLAQSIPAFQVGNTIGNPKLQPEISTEVEFGMDLKFLNNRLGLDATVYQRNVKDNILTVPLAASSGYSFQVLNIAKLQNRGIEILLTATPVLSDHFKWDISINWSKNVSKIIDLGGPSQIAVGGLGGTALIARVGRPAFEIEGSAPYYDAQGHIVVNNGGLPVNNPGQQVLGNTQYRFTGGITNRFTYKGFSLSSTFDVRNG
jgi:outer membrane receptor protein involved in Fe transport